jgi:PAS domain S-box-containing protein
MLHRALDGFATGTPFVNRFRRRDKDDAYPWIEARAQPLRDADGAIVQWYMVSIDIGDEVRAHEALRQREQELSQLVDALPIHVWSWTPAGKLAYVNKRSLEDLGLSSANLEDTTRVAQELVHPEDAPEVLRTSHSCLKTGDAFMMRYRRRWKDGNYRWIEGRCEPLRDRDGTIMHWYQVSIDIDDQMRAQEELRERERFLWQLVETLPAMIDCAAPNGEPIYRSQQLREFLGYQLEALDGTGKTRLDGTLDAGVHPDDVAGVKERYAHSLATGEPYARRHRLRRFDGEYRWVETRAEAMRNAEGAIVQWNVMCLDIDGEVRAQEALRLSQERLARASQAASLAELSASIAHEVNQPLAAVVANSYACQRWLAAEPPNIDRAHKTVERIIRDANAAADVVSRIRALFKQSVESRISTLLDGLIREARELMAEEALRRSVRMDVEIEGGLPSVAVDRVQLQQVLINLMRNGMEAMDAVAGEKILRVRVNRVAEAIRAEISDRGRGVERPDRIFEPFFTTKENGMGMGLAICRSIIESHGGKLWAETNESPGATFVFTLPIEAKDAA